MTLLIVERKLNNHWSRTFVILRYLFNYNHDVKLFESLQLFLKILKFQRYFLYKVENLEVFYII